MSNKIIVVEGEPIQWPKKLISTRGKGGKPLPFPRIYQRDPKGKFKRWRDAVEIQAKVQIDEIIKAPIPIRMGMIFFISRPKSISVKKRPFPVVTPDIDNYEYAITNIFKGLVYDDDSQIVSKLPGGLFYKETSIPLPEELRLLATEAMINDGWDNLVGIKEKLSTGFVGALIHVSAIHCSPEEELAKISKSWSM